jgi:hypothetical protein
MVSKTEETECWFNEWQYRNKNAGANAVVAPALK